MEELERHCELLCVAVGFDIQQERRTVRARLAYGPENVKKHLEKAAREEELVNHARLALPMIIEWEETRRRIEHAKKRKLVTTMFVDGVRTGTRKKRKEYVYDPERGWRSNSSSPPDTAPHSPTSISEVMDEMGLRPRLSPEEVEEVEEENHRMRQELRRAQEDHQRDLEQMRLMREERQRALEDQSM